MILIAKTNIREIEFSTNDIPLTNRSGYGIKGILKNKLRKNEIILSIYEKEIDKNE